MADEKPPEKRPDTPPTPPTERPGNEFEGLGRAPDDAEQPAPSEGEGAGSAILGWVIFILIFGVGNLILYATTGIFIIPIPRR
jgi:hypothetical protein